MVINCDHTIDRDILQAVMCGDFLFLTKKTCGNLW